MSMRGHGCVCSCATTVRGQEVAQLLHVRPAVEKTISNHQRYLAYPGFLQATCRSSEIRAITYAEDSYIKDVYSLRSTRILGCCEHSCSWPSGTWELLHKGPRRPGVQGILANLLEYGDGTPLLCLAHGGSQYGLVHLQNRPTAGQPRGRRWRCRARTRQGETCHRLECRSWNTRRRKLERCRGM